VAFYRGGVRTLSIAFFGVFGGYQAAQGLQTSINATLGFINLAACYCTFTLLCLVAPPLLAALEVRIGLRLVMFLSALAYMAMAVSNIFTANWAVPITMNVLVGVAAPMIWTCQNDYVGRCAYHAALGQCGSEERLEEQVQAMTTQFNSLFFSIYQCASMVSNVMASAIMLAFSGRQWLKDVLFLVLGGWVCLGGLIFFMMPHVGPAGGAVENPSLKATGALAVSDARMTFMIPLIFSNGMLLAFFLGTYPIDVICPVAGESFTGLVLAVFFGANAIATASWGRLISLKLVSRRTTYLAAALCQVAFLLVTTFWDHPINYVKQDGSWNRLRSPAWQDLAVVFLLAGLFATGDAFWECGPPATLQDFFAGTPHAVPAMANFKLWQSLGFAVQFFAGAALSSHVWLQVSILIALCTVSVCCLVLLGRRAAVN